MSVITGTQEPESAFDWNTDDIKDEFWSSFFSFNGVSATLHESASSTSHSTQYTTHKSRKPLNPFVHRVKLSKLYCFFLVFPMTFIAIVRCILMFVFALISYVIGNIGTMGVSAEDIETTPPSTWRHGVRWFVAHVTMRLYFFFAGFYWIKVTGKQAAANEAPILVLAPHSSLWDVMFVCKLGAPSIVAKAEQKDQCIFGKLTDFLRPIYVDRGSAASRKGVAKQIIDRANKIKSSDSNSWPQIILYPEGTCTNRSSLISFKPGAFAPGLPVQPVIIRYPNKFDCISWAFDGLSGFFVSWLTLCQFINYVEIEFLPVYNPSEAEKGNAQLYGQNVRRKMATALGMLTSDLALEDGFLLLYMSTNGIRKKLHLIRKIRLSLRIGENRETDLITELRNKSNIVWDVTLIEFLRNMNLDLVAGLNSTEMKDLFTIFNPTNTVGNSRTVADRIDLREYLFFALFFQRVVDSDVIMAHLFWMYCHNSALMIKSRFMMIMDRIFETIVIRAEQLFLSRVEKLTVINLDEFKTRMSTRVEYVRLYALEENGELGSPYPPTETRTELKDHKIKVD